MFDIIINKEKEIKNKMKKIMCNNPLVVYFTIFLVIPVFILFVIFAFSAIIIYPISWMLGLL